MNYDKLIEEIDELIEKIGKEDPKTEDYERMVKRLGELQQMALKWTEMELEETKTKEELVLKKRELITAEEDIRQRSKNSKRETVAEYGKTILGGIFTFGAIWLTGHIEERDIIRSKAWGFINGLRRM